jgi:hypothetical protein
MNVEQLPLVLQLDVAGNPHRWITYEDSAYYYAKGLVAWSMGEVEFDLRGGTNAKTGQQSKMTINTIVAIEGAINNKRMALFMTPPLTNSALFRRDWNVCAYCGEEFSNGELTRDHVLPRSRGGIDKWENVVAACGGCNKIKDNKTPEEANMPLLYVPYAPNRAEYLILKNRRILVDQMEFLIKRVPQESRLHERVAA